ncbi:hypothetical protein, partial [Bradyrhizobium sp. 144]|uniref:hypothetical protein n=1 Tax=Bradyrhizobium sp. 144 TaxID=2782620 RepID=UPI001FFB2CED
AVAQCLDVVGIRWPTPAAFLLRMSGLKLHRAGLRRYERLWRCAARESYRATFVATDAARVERLTSMDSLMIRWAR